MEQTIAAYTRNDGSLDDYFNCRKISIYKKQKQEWNVISTVLMDYSDKTDSCMIREHTLKILEDITDCHVLVGRYLSGLPFHIFDKKGFQIFDVKDLKSSTLDGVIKEIEENDYNEKIKQAMLKKAEPVETQINGNYYMDLIDLMKACPDITSKKALLGFIKNKPFMELTLHCSHIPPWMESMNLDIKKMKDQEGNIIAVISKQMV